MDYPRKKSFAAELLAKRQKKKPSAILVVAVIVAVIAVGYALYMRFDTKEIPTETVAPPTEETPITSLAVLPLNDMTGDLEQEYFCDGMHEALITDLSKISALRVIGRTSVMQFRNTEKTIPEIAKELGVDALVEGSVFRADNTVRITVQLVSAFPERHLWADTFDRELEDVLALYNEVAMAIANEIEIAVTSEEKKRLSSTRTVNPEAYDLYLMGRHFLREVNHDKALYYNLQAIEKDSSFAEPYAEISFLLAYQGRYESIVSNKPYIEAKKALEKAFELNDTIPGVYHAQAIINMWFEWDWYAAEINFKKAIDLDPSYMTTYIHIDDLLIILGKEQEALEFLRKAMEIDPLSQEILNSTLSTLGYVGHYKEAEQIYRKYIEINPTNPSIPQVYLKIGLIYAAQGKYDEAIASFTKRAELIRDTPPNAYIGYVYGLMGKRAEAEKMLIEVPDPSLERFYLLLGLKDFDPIFEMLENLYNEQYPIISNVILNCKRYSKDIVADPRWKALMKKMGLPE